MKGLAKFGSPRQDRAELAAYIAEMTAELAQGAELPMLAYFLNLARVEAQIAVRETDGSLLRGSK